METRFKIATCVETGEYHKIRNKPCQDAAGKYETEDCAVITVCDGAGSVETSELDSQFVCNNLPKYLAENFDRLYEMDDMLLAKDILKYLNECRGKTELNCTMLATCMHTNGKCIHLHIGDGMIFGRKRDGAYHLISDAENGSESYITFFLSGINAKKHIRVSREECDEVLMTSDGLTDILYSDGKVMNAVAIMTEWLKHNEPAETEAKYIQEMKELFSERTRDDMSIAVMIRKGDFI